MMKYISILLFLLLALTGIGLANIENEESESNSSNKSFNPKNIKLVQTGENSKVKLNNLALPLIRKVHVNDTPAIDVLTRFTPTLYTKADLEKKLLEIREIGKVSQKLEITVSTCEHMSLYQEVLDWIGTPYKVGGMSKKSVDCSGFIGLIYKSVYDIALPRASIEMANTLKETVVSKEELEPGNLVFFATRGPKSINHVGIYLGDNKFIHASIKRGVIVSSLDDKYYAKAWQRGAKVN